MWKQSVPCRFKPYINIADNPMKPTLEYWVIFKGSIRVHHCYQILLSWYLKCIFNAVKTTAKLQNTWPLICMSLNKNSANNLSLSPSSLLLHWARDGEDPSQREGSQEAD